MVTYSCILENPMDRRADGLQSMGSQRVRHDSATKQNNVSSVFATCNLSVKICKSIYWSIDLNAVIGHM